MPTWTSNIPSQVKPYANVGAFPITGSVKTIYIAEDTDIAYYWTGSAYQPISIQDLSGLVPYTGATTDVDLGNNDLNAEGVKIKGTAGNGHLNMKHQSSNPTAGGQETVIFAGSDGEPRFKNDGNAVEQFASREWVNLQGFQTTPIVVNSNITAQNDRVYHVVANATFTDPTGVEGRGYVVIVRDGSATIGGNTGGAGTINYRLFRSGTWTTYQFWNINQLTNAFVPQSRTINGLDLSANRTLTTVNINDSTNRRYVTDAQLTVIGNTSGTNTGDETASSILSKLGWQIITKPSDQTTSSLTAVVVTDFESNTLTAGRYAINGTIRISSNSTTGMSLGAVIPSNATMALEVLGRGSTTANSTRVTLTDSNILSSLAFAQVNGNTVVSINGTITIGTTSGTLSFIFAKVTSGVAGVLSEGTQISIQKI